MNQPTEAQTTYTIGMLFLAALTHLSSKDLREIEDQLVEDALHKDTPEREKALMLAHKHAIEQWRMTSPSPNVGEAS